MKNLQYPINEGLINKTWYLGKK